MGPELCYYVEGQDEEIEEYSNAVDIWSVGCIAFKLIAKKPPFPPGPSLRRYCANQDLFPKDILTSRTSLACAAFIERLLQAEPTQRPSARTAAEDPWILSDSKTTVSIRPEKGVDLNPKDGSGRTPLSYAARKGHEAVVKLLVEKGVDPNPKDGALDHTTDKANALREHQTEFQKSDDRTSYQSSEFEEDSTIRDSKNSVSRINDEMSDVVKLTSSQDLNKSSRQGFHF